jgi:4'-phosphopantetheinyl transferase
MTGWDAAPDALAVAAGEAHVWRLRLVQPAGELARLGATLSDDERARAARFYFERDRAAFTVVRGALRTLLGGYLGTPPGALVFGYRHKGKPYLEAPLDDLQFNVSHSGDFALLAFTRGCAIGVDVERRRRLDDLDAMARISFSPDEYAALHRLAPADHAAAFFACWSRKEAFIKVTGEGISQLADFDVTLAPGEPMRLLRVRGVAPDALPWTLHALPEIADHAAALAVEALAIQLRCWDWPPARGLGAG